VTRLKDLQDHDTTDRVAVQPAGSEREPCLTVITGRVRGQVYRLPSGVHIIGRGLNADITLDEASVSRHHAKVEIRPDHSARIDDLGSTNGTWVRGVNVRHAEVNPGDKLRIGSSVVLRFDQFDELDIKLHEDLLAASTMDTLTGCQNRSYFEAELPREVAYARRAGSELSVAIIDIDLFKTVNDTWGHQFGDVVLRLVARALQDGVRAYDTISRWGGDEFAVVLRGATIDQAHAVLDRIAQRLRAVTWPDTEKPPRITLSIGIANLGADNAEDADRLLGVADARMYAAKKGGRDRIVAAGEFTFDRKTGKKTLDLTPPRPRLQELQRRRAAETVQLREPLRTTPPDRRRTEESE